jgi:polygalacturonase
MRSFILLSSLLPIVLACDSAESDACASIITASSAAAATFCATYTQAANSATSGLPSWATACSNSPKHISSACSCLLPATLATVTATSFPATSTVASVTTSSSAVVTSSAASSSTATAVTGTACTVTDSDGISSAVASCTNIVLQGIAMPADVSLDLTDLKAGTTVTFAGNTSFGYTEDSDFNPVQIKGKNLTITGASGHVISGNGAAYWDGQGSNGGSDKPDHFIVLKDLINSKVTNLNIENWPVHCFDITGGDGLYMSDLTLDNTAGDAANSKSGGLPAAHNSDGFDISSTSNMILANSVVKNQDDCVAVTSGYNVTITGMTCSGGHGLSIGSVGGKSNNTVVDITFSDSTITDSENGCRIKTNSGTTGTIENITYANITLSGISDYGIDIQQDYLNGGPTGDPTDGVIISGVTFYNVTGTVTDDAYNYYILCGSDSCSDFTFTDVSITGGNATSCNYPSTGCPS